MLDNIHVSRVGLWDTAKKIYVDIFSERLTDSRFYFTVFN